MIESTKKIRVLTLVQSIGLSGGGERLAREITKGLDPDRFQRTLCVTRWDPSSRKAPVVAEALRELDRAGVRFLGLERNSSFDLWSLRPLLDELKRGGTDVLHAHMFGSNVWAAMLGTLARTPVIVAHEHTWSYEGQPLRRFLDRELIARRSDAFIAVSSEDRRRMIEIERIAPEDVIFIPNGIPTPAPPSGKDVRAELGLAPDTPLIGSVGTLRAQKRFDLLVDAAAELRRMIPEIRVAIAGEGRAKADLERQIERLGLGETVILLGRRDDVPDFLSVLDVAVNCSDFEGSPLSIMEYMEASLPVVATRVGGVPDLIEEGVNGLLVEPGQPGALANAVAALLGDPERSAEIGRENRRRRSEQFDITTMTGRLEALYVELLSRSART